jgi:glucose-6-phosphate dehydrogenase assembly protein OpcA
MTSESGEIRLAQFERGDAIEVPLGRVEAELSALWRQAAAGRAGEKPRPVTRACLWNLIVRVGNDEFASAKKLIDELSKSIPARVIILHTDPAAPEQPIRAWVEANWRRPDAGHASGSDEVTLFAAGPAVDRLPSLVRALVITDAPTAMLWWGPPPAESAAVRDLLREVDRLIVDTRKLPSETGLLDYERIATQFPELELVDCAWLGVRPLRGLCAGLFDPPGDPDRLRALDRVRVISGVTGCQSRGLLTLGWLASRLGWRTFRKDTSTPEIRRWRAERSGGTVLVELETRLGGATHGVRGLELEAGADQWILKRENQCLDVTRSDGPGRRQPVRTHTDAELVTSALGARGRDAIFRDALGHAVQLVSAS